MAEADMVAVLLPHAEAYRRKVLLAETGFVFVCACTTAVLAWLLVPQFPESSVRLISQVANLAKISDLLDKAFGDGTAARLARRLPWVSAGLAGAALAWRHRKLVRWAA